jgi:hypothetical protein
VLSEGIRWCGVRQHCLKDTARAARRVVSRALTGGAGLWCFTAISVLSSLKTQVDFNPYRRSNCLAKKRMASNDKLDSIWTPLPKLFNNIYTTGSIALLLGCRQLVLFWDLHT